MPILMLVSRLAGSIFALVLVACGHTAVGGEPGESTTGSLPGSTTSIPRSSTTTTPTTTTSLPATTTTLSTEAATLEALGLEAGATIDRPENLVTLPPAVDYSFPSDLFPYPRARISSRIEIDEDSFDEPMGDDSGYIITYVPGFTIWDHPAGFREVRVEGGDFMTLNQDGTWVVSDRFEWPPFSPFVGWEEANSGYEGMLFAGFTVEGYEEIAGVETAHLRLKDAPPDMWADLWVDANAVVMRVVVDLEVEEDQRGNRMWIIWDTLTVDPGDVGPLPPG